MKEVRIGEIKNSLLGHAPAAEVRYTNQEIIDKLVDLQETMANQVFAVSHAEHFVAKDIMIHFKALAEEYGLAESTEYRRLSMNMRFLGYTIGSLKKGAKGERRTREGLRVMSFDPNVRILYNITLQGDSSKTEYDAIVSTPYGIFVVEAKNFSGTAYISPKGMLQRDTDSNDDYNLGERMHNKEFLLRSCLGDLATVPYQGLLLYVDESADIVDDYRQIPITYCNTVAATIRRYDTGEVSILPDQAVEIENSLVAHQVENKGVCKVDCDQIISDFASLMSEIEDKADEVNHADDDEANPVGKEPQSTQEYSQPIRIRKTQPKKRMKTWQKVTLGAVVGFAGGIFVGTKL